MPYETTIFTSAEPPQESIDPIGSRPFVKKLGKIVLTEDAYDELQAYLVEHAHEAPKSRKAMGRSHPEYHLVGKLVEKGLQADLKDRRLTELSQAILSLRRILRSVAQVEVKSLPCPPKIDPMWWAEKDRERLDAAHQAISEGVRQALTLLDSVSK